jgi:hypothetical protein
MPGLVEAAVRCGVEGFVNPENSKEKKESYVSLVSMLIAFVIAIVILSLVGQLLWNGVIVDLFTFARPAKNIWQILGLFVFVSLLV